MSVFVGGLFETVVVLFFLLMSGDTFLRRLVEILPRFRDKRQAIEISQQIEQDISAYLITITIMNAAVGFATAGVMWLCGVGDPLLWGAVAFLFNYVPILGPMIGLLTFTLAGLLSVNSLWGALLPAGLYLAIGRGRDDYADAVGAAIHPQSCPCHLGAHFLVLDVGCSGRHPRRAHVGNCQDHLR
jgi:predicted PurR-regulated permease PerM